MSWTSLSSDDWQESVDDAADQLAQTQMHDVLATFTLVPPYLTPEQLSASVHDGDLEMTGDYVPDTQLTLVLGDLTVRGKLSTQSAGGADGNATLVVFGTVRAKSIVNDWASLLIATGDCHVSDWVMADREDSALIIGGDFSTPIFIGMDIWASVGGSAQMGAGKGYALTLDHITTGRVGTPIYPDQPFDTLRANLALPPPSQTAVQEAVDLLNQRLFETGTIWPSE